MLVLEILTSIHVAVTDKPGTALGHFGHLDILILLLPVRFYPSLFLFL